MAPPDPTLSPATAARLRGLRIRVTLLIALLATVAVSVFAVLVIRLDRQLRDEQVDTELLRIGDTATRQLSFEEGWLQPEAPSIEGAVVALTPSFSIAEFEEQQDVWDLPDPTDDELDEFVTLAFEEAESDGQTFLLSVLLEEDGFGEVADEINYVELLEEGETTVGPVEFENDDGEREVFGPVELVLDELIDRLYQEPPPELADEAYRRYVEVEAEEAGIELEFETVFFVAPSNPLDEEVMFAITDTVTENPSAVFTDTVVTRSGADDGTTNGQAWSVRATPLRDGPEVRGAVIAVLDPAQFDDAHAQLRAQVILLALAVVAASIVAAWFVAARTIRPTARALAQQERFLADAAHELRTPIAAIRLTAESAQPESAATNLARVAELAADASTLTDDLLTLARMDADRLDLQREPVRLDLLVEAAVAAVPGAEEAIATSGPSPVVEADARLLERALGNLIRNAIAHGEATAERPASIHIDHVGSEVTVTVRDQGPGIDPEVAAELFERFRSRTGSRGHGLGLPLARWIARAHGGELELQEPAEGGATFVLTLPLPTA